MKTFCAVVMLVLASATASLAQDQPPVTERSESVQASDIRRTPARVMDRKFWAVASALNTAMVFDTKSTFDVSKTCPNCGEANPLVRPFVRRGPVPTYIAGELFDAGVMTVAAKMKGSERTWARRTWWVMPIALVTGHTIAYRHNVNLFK
jgi:hypothetical protein